MKCFQKTIYMLKWPQISYTTIIILSMFSILFKNCDKTQAVGKTGNWDKTANTHNEHCTTLATIFDSMNRGKEMSCEATCLSPYSACTAVQIQYDFLKTTGRVLLPQSTIDPFKVCFPKADPGNALDTCKSVSDL